MSFPRPHRILQGTRVHGGGRLRLRGFSLVEAMCALAVFSAGVLGIARLQSVAVQQTAAAGYRNQAAWLAKDLVSRMWLADRSPGMLQASFGSTGGAGYAAWLATVQASGLPGVSARAPQVVVAPMAGGGASPVASAQATVTIFWKAPGDADFHRYVATAQIK